MRLLRPVLAASLVVGGLALATSAAADSPPRPAMHVTPKPFDIQMADFIFPSGLRVIFQEDHSEPVVSVTMVVDHGSQDDPQGREGIAHLIEHLWFRSVQPGPDGKDAPKIMDFIKQMGAQFNATTSEDRTNFLTVARSPLLPTLMRLESLRLEDAVRKVTNENVLVEREVVRNELRLRYENGGSAFFGLLSGKLWPQGHPYHRDTIGSHDSLNAITLADVQEYVKKYYHPSEATLVVVGDFSLKGAGQLVTDSFEIDKLAAPGDATGESLSRPSDPKIRISGKPVEPPVPAQPIEVKGDVTNLETFHVAVQKPAVVVGWSLPSAYTQEDAVRAAAVTQLNIAIRSELYPDTDYSKEDSTALDNASNTGCFEQPGRYGTTVACYVQTGDDDPAKMVERALNGVYKLYDRGDNYATFQKRIFNLSQQSGMAGMFQTVDDVTNLFGGRSDAISDFVHFTGDPLYYSREIEWRNSFSIDQVRDYAGKWFDRKRAVAISVKPLEDGDLTLDGSDSAYRGQSRDVTTLTLFDPTQVTPKVIHDTIVVPDTKKIVQETLPNGMKLVIMPHTNGPLVQLGVVFQGGSRSVDALRDQAIFGSAMTSIPHADTVDPLAIAGDVSYSFGNLNAQIHASAAAGNVKDAAYTVRWRLDNLQVDTDGKLDWVKTNKKDILTWMKKPEDAAGPIQLQRLFPNHIFGQYLTHKDWDTIGKLGNGDGAAYLARELRPKNTALFIVGNITVEEAREAAKTYFGGWTGWGKEPANWTVPKSEFAAPPAPPARQIILFNKDTASQTDVSYMCQLAPITQENQWAAEVMSDTIGDALWLALREQTGASYGAYPYVQYFNGGVGIFGQGVQVQNDTTGFAVKTFLDQGERAKAGKLDDRIIATQKYNNAQAYVLNQVSTYAMFNRLVGTYNRGWGMDYFDHIADRIGNVQQKDFPPLLERCVGHEVITAVGPLSIIKPQFDKLGLAVEVFDVDAFRKQYRVDQGLPVEKEDKKKDEKK